MHDARYSQWIRRLLTCIALLGGACGSDRDSAPPADPSTSRAREKLCSLPGGAASVRSEAELEPLCGCTRIEGDVSIDASALADLDCLAPLREVTGALSISAPQPSLDSIDGLSSLERVRTLSLTGLAVRGVEPLRKLKTAESVSLTRLASLESLVGLEGTFGRFQLSECERVTDLRGLRAEVRDLWLDKSPQLRSLEGFSGLAAFEDAETTPTIRLESLPALESLDGLFREDAPRIARLQLMGLPKVERIDVRSARELGALVVRTCTALTVMRGFEALETIGQLHLTGLPELPSLPEFTGLRSAVDLELIELPKVADLRQLSNLTALDRIAFTMMDSLVSLHGLEKVTRSDRILLEDLLALESVDGLSGLMHVNTLWIGGDDKLESLRGLGLVEAGELVVRYNEALTTLDGLESLRRVETLDVSENPKLVSVRALEGIEQAGRVFARANHALPPCELERLSAQLPSDTTREFGDNGPPGSCAP